MFLLTVDDVKNYLIDNATKLISTAVVIVVCLLLVLISKIIMKRKISMRRRITSPCVIMWNQALHSRLSLC